MRKGRKRTAPAICRGVMVWPERGRTIYIISAKSPEKREANPWGSTWPGAKGGGLRRSKRVFVARTKAPLVTPKKRAKTTAATNRDR
jgi:hypothetical protein